jgi:hypothetical protein
MQKKILRIGVATPILRNQKPIKMKKCNHYFIKSKTNYNEKNCNPYSMKSKTNFNEKNCNPYTIKLKKNNPYSFKSNT